MVTQVDIDWVQGPMKGVGRTVTSGNRCSVKDVAGGRGGLWEEEGGRYTGNDEGDVGILVTC